MAGYCFKALFVREVQVLVMGVDNGAGVLMPKFAGLLQDWMSFLWPDHRLSCKITMRKKNLYFFYSVYVVLLWFDPCFCMCY